MIKILNSQELIKQYPFLEKRMNTRAISHTHAVLDYQLTYDMASWLFQELNWSYKAIHITENNIDKDIVLLEKAEDAIAFKLAWS